MSQADEQLPPHWTAEDVRRDGMMIAAHAGKWSIYNPGGVLLIDTCPCCRRPMLTARAARLVCNAVFPMPSTEQSACC